MTSTDPNTAAPRQRDVVHVRHALEPHHRYPGVVIDVFPQPRIKDGDRYRVEFPGGITAWFGYDELTVISWRAGRDTVLTDLAAIRTILHHAIVVAERHDVLHRKLGDLFDTVTTTAHTYLGGSLDGLLPTGAADLPTPAPDGHAPARSRPNPPPRAAGEPTMVLDGTVRIREPREANEYRLATIIDITYSTPHTTHIRTLRVRFPNGQERTYTPHEVTVCRRDDDHAALVAAFTATLLGLRDACRIAHDYDEALSADITAVLTSIRDTVQSRLDVTLDPAHLDTAAGAAEVTA